LNLGKLNWSDKLKEFPTVGKKREEKKPSANTLGGGSVPRGKQKTWIRRRGKQGL